MKPRIAITASLGEVEGGRRIHLPITYADAVAAAGGTPVILAPPRDAAWAKDLLGVADALLLAGGPDLDAQVWGEANHPKADVMDPRRQEADLAWIAVADAHRLPVLGICLGCQEMAVSRGGSLIQHLPDEPDNLAHHSGRGEPRMVHAVTVEAESLLARVVGAGRVEVNSAHHQAVRHQGRAMRVVARSPDGGVEAIEDPTRGRFFLGVQWHPEDIIDRPPHLALFEALCQAAAEKRTA